MRKLLRALFVPAMVCLSLSASSQVTLTGTSYFQDFNSITTDSLPAGFTVRTGATAAAIGAEVALNPKTATAWNFGTGRYNNYASHNSGLASNASTALQSAATDRALGLRQSTGFGDQGAAFVFQVANTTGLSSFTLDFKLQSLDLSITRITTWRVDYGFGSSPSSFSTATTTGTLTTGNSTFTSNSIHVDFGSALDNQSGIVTIRIVALGATTGSGSRPSTGIDDFTLGWSTGGSSTPTLAVSPSSLTFPTTEIGSTSAAQTYILTAANLTSDVTVTAPAAFTVSTDDITYNSLLTILQTDAALATGKTIYVKFAPTTATAYSDAVTNASTGATSKVVGVTGNGVSYIHLVTSPYTETFDGIGTTIPDGLTAWTGASASSLGTQATISKTITSWTSTGGGFFNYASGDIGTSEPQSTATDRAVGIRQTSGVGDPGGAFVFQIGNTTGKMNFTLDFNLQSLDAGSPRTTTWQVDYGLGSNPSAFTVVPTIPGTLTTGGATFSDNAVHVDFGSALDNYSGVITIRIVTLTASAGNNNRPTTGIDDVVLTWEDPTAKTITLNATSLNFPTTNIGSSNTQTYTIVGQTNLDQPVIITTAAPYSVSTDNTTFSSSVSVNPADATNKTIYVKFAPTAAGVFNGTVTNASVGAVSKTITLTGEATDPSTLTFNFNSCTISSIPGSGFLSINTIGSQKWGCSQYGQNSTNGISVNGYVSGSGAQTNEAWLISPALHLNGIVNMPVLSFYSRGEFTGPILKLFVSTDYDGSSSPATATWTEITTANFPTPPGSATTTWTLSDNIDLSAYKSAANVYLAFQYTSSPATNAARWSIDDVTITDQSTLLLVSPTQLNFGEVATGANSTGQAVSVRAVGSTDITLTLPVGYQISTDNTTFSTSPLVIDQATAAAGTTVYIRFSPTLKKLTVAGNLNISGTGINKNSVALSGSSYPRTETFDVACYNLAFFGSNPTNNPTPAKITGQINNIATVMQHLNADVVGFEEMSSDSALNELLLQMPGYSAVTSDRWSYSFQPADPNFPPQKMGFLYKTATMTLSAAEPPRVLFRDMYDSARLGQSTRVSSSFWASGRLPYMATFDVNINGQMKKVRLVVIHGKSSSDAASYNRRLFDAQVLKDTLDAVYKNDNVIIMGDYNDRLYGSIYSGSSVSPYNPFNTDNASYAPLTRSLDSAGKVSFIGGSGLIDHLVITQPLRMNYIDSSTAIEDARLYISGYNDSTASDHLPVFTRFTFAASGPLPITLLEFTARPKNNVVLVNWTTAMEQNNKYFIIERSADGRSFTAIGRVSGAGTSNSMLHYQFTDVNPLPGTSYYRLQQVDMDGQFSLSSIATVRIDSEGKTAMTVSPNPVRNYMNININTSGKTYTMRVSGVDGRILINGSGSVNQLNQQLNSRLNSLAPGVYVLSTDNAEEHYTIKFVKQ
jgi:trimeric autotransporter adhesin